MSGHNPDERYVRSSAKNRYENYVREGYVMAPFDNGKMRTKKWQ